MQSVSEAVLRAVNSSRKQYNILTCPCHESYETCLCNTGHEFFAIRAQGVKDWNTKYRPTPNNYLVLDGTKDQIKPDMVFDIVLSQNKFGQFQILKPLADQMNIPFVSLEHTLPVPEWGIEQRQACKQMRGDINVFISEYSVKEWGFSLDDPTVVVVEHGIDINQFKSEAGKKDGKVLTVVNDWINRDWCCNFSLYKELCLDTRMPINPLGDTTKFSNPAPSTEALVNAYQRASVFLNTSTISPVPTALMEAMACGCPVVTTSTCMIPNIVKDGYNGFISNDKAYLKDRLDWCLANPDKAAEIGQNARKTIIEKYSLARFTDNWNNVFAKVYGACHYE